MFRKSLFLSLTLLTLALAGCAGAPQVAMAPTAAPQPDDTIVELQLMGGESPNVMVAGKEYPIIVGVAPLSARADVGGVKVYGDRGITCKQSTADTYTWYCTGTEPAQVAIIKAELTGTALAAAPGHLVVQVVPAPTAGPTQATTEPVATEPKQPEAAPPAAAPSSEPAPSQQPPAEPAPSQQPAVQPTKPGPAASTGSCPPRKRERVIITKPAVVFDNLKDMQSIQWDVEVSGKVVDPAAQGGRKLWLIVWPEPLPDKPGYVPSLHPQSDIDAEGKFPATYVDANGGFVQLARFGESWLKNVGECFDLLAVFVDDSGHQAFESYLQKAYKRGSWPGIAEGDMPKGMQIVGAAWDLIRE